MTTNGEKKVTWGLLVGTSTLLLALLGAVGSGVLGDIDKLHSQQHGIENRMTLLENNLSHIKEALSRLEIKVDQILKSTEE